MGKYFYISKKCTKEAKKHGQLHRVKDFCEKHNSSTTQRIPNVSSINRWFVDKKMENKKYRLIGYIEDKDTENEDKLIVLHRFLKKESHEYDHFDFDTSLPDDVYKKCLAEYKSEKQNEQKQSTGRPRIERPNQEEQEYIDGFPLMSKNEKDKDDCLICESDEWVLNIKHHENEFSSLRDIIYEIIGDDSGTYVSKPFFELRLIYRYFPELKKLFLAGLVKPEHSKKLIENYSDVLEPEVVEEEKLLKNSRRQYGWTVLEKLSEWEALQKDQEANLALSSEETKVLESVAICHETCKAERDENQGFPLFVNGRAGSGKSTLLLYLFARYLKYHYESGCKTAPPVFFTCSEDLIKKSKEITQTLLQVNPDYKYKENKRDMASIVESAFRVFHSYLYSLLKEEEKKLFPKKKEVSFSKFRILWKNKCGRHQHSLRDYNPDLSWHVIRTYIKGYGSADDEEDDGYMTPEEYKCLSQKERTVTDRAFEDVHTKVWSWYKSRDYWDNQDLVKHLLTKSDRIKSDFPAVFCDEAQDFTRMELELILRLSLFYKRELYSHELSKRPFAFAGDEFQTLNPTGFRWEQIKASFYDKLVGPLDPSNKSGINCQELLYNYRSGEKIARLCNSVQLLRLALFSDVKMSPQKSWSEKGNALTPQYFEKEIYKDGLIDQLKKNPDLRIVVPCLKGEEVEFVENEDDKFLLSFVDVDEEKDGTKTAGRIYSPEGIKGLEDTQVVVYNFGHKAADTILRKLATDLEIEKFDQNSLEEEYFLNRLYVAVSRARQKLFIIDSQEGIENFWLRFTDRDVQSRIVKQLRDKEAKKWQDGKLGGCEPGAIDSISADPISSIESAEKNRERGRATKDPDLLRKAAISFENAAGMDCNLSKKKEFQESAHECRGEAFFIEEKYHEAADHFIEGHKYSQASDAYWRLGDEQGWKGIVSCAEKKDQELKLNLEFKVASFCLMKHKNIENYRNLFESAKDQAGLYNEKFLTDATWSNTFQKITEDLSSFVRTTSTNEYIKDLKLCCVYINKLEEKGLEINNFFSRAILLYYARQFEDAVQFFEKQGSPSCPEYWESILEIKKYPQTISAFYNLKRYTKGYDEFSSNPDVELDKDQIQMMVRICSKLQKHEGIITCCLKMDFDALLPLLNEFREESDKQQGFFSVARGFIKKCLDNNYTMAAFNLTMNTDRNIELSSGTTFNPSELNLSRSDQCKLQEIFIEEGELLTEPDITPCDLWRLAQSFEKTKRSKYLEKAMILFIKSTLTKKRGDVFYNIFVEESNVNLADKPRDHTFSVHHKMLNLKKNLIDKLKRIWIEGVVSIDRWDYVPNKDEESRKRSLLSEIVVRHIKESLTPSFIKGLSINLVELAYKLEENSKYITAMKVYENLFKGYNGSESIFCELRWIKCKLKHAEYEESKNPIKAKELRAEAAEHTQSMRIDSSRIPDLPEVNKSVVDNIKTLKPDYQKPTTGPIKRQPCSLNFNHQEKKKRIVVQDKDENMLFVDYTNTQVKSDDIIVVNSGVDLFSCPKWNLLISFDKSTIYFTSTKTNKTLKEFAVK